ncbi:high light inducible protein [Microcoleus sp. FACHB-831]|uniref:chlorophyll a/b-binding protein n=1 Tax=Microcoleus sp. FACHB-831 TaxID=2692827 RepID=UPI001686363D|nr:chlorophyll a/b-binding protein [Microcoleus sp. FACHB-831]MBD1920795.1 high light inducible protein [Microcoleus sp. FACHB-831]
MNPETNTTPSAQPSLQENYNQPEPAFGFSSYAEQLNGRFAMIGFVGLLLLELFTQQDLFTWLGLR